ncbi:hypothetical protein F8M41_009312 [Gigaspora margarita]|uniref:Uncharacterized protein n=1 Tax=Gigaspora margarita TaxID=4874 RepID=A0A8H4B4B0_GIGMA|nr:hypothetical protein F8M41_009312 [Gigaspora margarita]
MNLLDDEVPVDSEEFDVTEVLVDDVLEDSDNSNFTDNVLEDMTTKFEGFNITSAYNNLVKILTHSKYRKEDVTKNIQQIQKWRNRLPLIKIHQHNVPLCMNQTPFTYNSTKKAFAISPLMHLEHVLNNPVLMSKMYFGPGFYIIFVLLFFVLLEFYRAGDFLMFQEQLSIFICRVRGIIVDETDNDSFKLKVNNIFMHENLPSIHSTDNYHIRGNGKELWLNERKPNLVNLTNVK